VSGEASVNVGTAGRDKGSAAILAWPADTAYFDAIS
jgi:hypothetical protein